MGDLHAVRIGGPALRLVEGAGKDAATDASDRAILTEIRAGVLGRFNVLVDRHKAALLRYLYLHSRRTRSGGGSRPNVFLKLFRNPPTGAAGGTVKTWLFTVARHCLTDYRRASRRREGLHRKLLRLTPRDAGMDRSDCGGAAGGTPTDRRLAGATAGRAGAGPRPPRVRGLDRLGDCRGHGGGAGDGEVADAIWIGEGRRTSAEGGSGMTRVTQEIMDLAEGNAAEAARLQAALDALTMQERQSRVASMRASGRGWRRGLAGGACGCACWGMRRCSWRECGLGRRRFRSTRGG